MIVDGTPGYGYEAGHVSGAACWPGCLLMATPAQLSRRATKYRITRADLVALIELTDGLCMLCRRCHASVIEHCHQTSRVRGLVCKWCNTRIAGLESGFRGRNAYSRGYSCCCLIDGHRGPDIGFETATYRFLDHAMDLPGHDVRAAFAHLARNPYPRG